MMCDREVEATKLIQPIMKQLEGANKKLESNETDLKETMQQYLQLIQDAQVRARRQTFRISWELG